MEMTAAAETNLLSKEISSTIKNLQESKFKDVDFSSSGKRIDKDSTIKTTSFGGRNVKEVGVKTQNAFIDLLTGVNGKVKNLEANLTEANNEAEKLETERDMIDEQFQELKSFFLEAQEKLSTAEEAIDKAAKDLNLNLTGKSVADQFKEIASKNKEILKNVAQAFGMDTKDFDSQSTTNIISAMTTQLKGLVEDKNKAQATLENTRNELETANKQIEELKENIEGAKKVLGELEKKVESWKIDFSKAEVQDAYKMQKKSRVNDNAEFLTKLKKDK
jgi:chromosome segregation ATPase